MTALLAISQSLSATLLAPEGIWQHPIFAAEFWDPFTRGVRIAIAAIGALALLYDIRRQRLGKFMRMRTRRRVAWIFTIVAFGLYFDFFNPVTRPIGTYHRHEFYHYYLGSKYFAELGYKRLYECSMVAEVENGRLDEVKNRDIRDLKANLMTPVSETYVLTEPEQCKKHFSPARWESFKRETSWFHDNIDKPGWEGMQHDHGYNPPPVWTMLGQAIGRHTEASDRLFKLLSCLDVALHAGILLLFNWAFGFRVMAVAAVFWGANAPADTAFIGGAFLRQDWLFLLVAAVCCARKRELFFAGFALTWSALLRIFPGIFVFGWLVIAGIAIVASIRRGVRHPTGGTARGWLAYLHPDHRRVFAGCVVAMATLVPTSLIVCGASSYREFFDHTLGTHQNTPLTNHMGLETILVHNWDGRMRFAQDDNRTDAFQGWKNGRLERFRNMRPIFIAIVLGVVAWTGWALRRTRLLWVGTALSLPLVMCLTNLTNYYYSMFMVGAALVAVRPQLGVPFLFVSALGKLLQYSPTGFFFLDDRWAAQSWLHFTLALMLLAGYSRPFSLAALKAWWEGNPEPKKPKSPSQTPLPTEPRLPT